MKLSLNNGNDDFYDGHPSGAAAVPRDGAALSVFAEFYADADAAAALAKEMSFPCVCKKEWTSPYWGCDTVQNGCETLIDDDGEAVACDGDAPWCIVENPGCGHQRGDGSVDDSSVSPDGQWAYCDPALDPLRAAEAAAGTLPVGISATHFGVRTVLSGDVLKDAAVRVGLDWSCSGENPSFEDADGNPCDDWDGYDCARADVDYGYTVAETQSLIANCPICCAGEVPEEMSMEDLDAAVAQGGAAAKQHVKEMTIDTGFATFMVSLAARSAGPRRAHTPMPRAPPPPRSPPPPPPPPLRPQSYAIVSCTSLLISYIFFVN